MARRFCVRALAGDHNTDKHDMFGRDCPSPPLTPEPSPSHLSLSCIPTLEASEYISVYFLFALVFLTSGADEFPMAYIGLPLNLFERLSPVHILPTLGLASQWIYCPHFGNE